MTDIDKKIKEQYEKVPTEENGKNVEGEIPSSFGLGVRHVQALLVFTCICVNLIGRAHLAVTIVAMVTPKHNASLNHTAGPGHLHDLSNVTVDDINVTPLNLTVDEINVTPLNFTADEISASYNETDLAAKDGNLTADVMDALRNASAFGTKDTDNGLANNQESVGTVYRTYPWPTWVQEMLLGSFFVGYAISMWPTGLAVQRVGGKRPLQAGLFISGILSIATPHLALWGGWQAVAVARVATGLAQAGTFPSAMALVSQWSPPSERATISTYVFIGSMIGTVVAFQLAGLLAASPLGWPSTFWVGGVLGLTACALVTVFGHPSPDNHPTISDAERNFILGKVFDGQQRKRIPTPWRRMLSSRAVWGSFASHFGSACVFMFMFTQVPTYMHHILGVDIKSSGLLSSLPYLANAVASVVVGYLSDYITNRGLLTLRMARIISATIASVVPAVCLLLLGYTRRPELAIPALIVAMVAFAGTHTSWMVNYIDLTPNFSGTLMATGNTLMNVAAIGLPMLVARIVTDENNPVQWRVVLFTLSVGSLLCNAVFVTFVSADVQPWNEPEEPESKEMEAKRKS